MKKHFDKISKNKFRLYTLFIFFINDLYNFFNLYQKYQDKSYFIRLIKHSLELSGNTSLLSNMTSGFYDQLFILFLNWLVASLSLLSIFHLIMYLLFYRNKRGAYVYLLSVSIVACLFFLITPLNSLSKFNIDSILSLIQGLSYCYVTVGLVKFLPKNKSKKQVPQNDNF